MPERLVHTGRRIRVYLETATAADGTTFTRDVVRHPGAVVILPIVSPTEICLLQNERFAVGETLWELPAGTLEPPEPIIDAAQRELREETGYTATNWTSLGFLYASPGVLDEKLHLFIAENLTPGEQKLEAGEVIRPVTLALDEAIAMCLDGRIRDCKTVTAILLWERRATQLSK